MLWDDQVRSQLKRFVSTELRAGRPVSVTRAARWLQRRSPDSSNDETRELAREVLRDLERSPRNRPRHPTIS
jgi:hypothetical protein